MGAIKRGLFGGLNPKRLLGVESLKVQTKAVKQIFKGLRQLSTKGSDTTETFEECMERYSLSEEDLQQRMKKSLQTVKICFGLALPVLGYMFYQFGHVGSMLGGLSCILLLLFLLVTAFREHFNLFQMRQRRLGCTFQEWFRSLTGKTKKEMDSRKENL